MARGAGKSNVQIVVGSSGAAAKQSSRQTSAAGAGRVKLFTLVVHFQAAGVNGKKANGAILTIADAASLAAKADKPHGMSTFSSRAMAQMKFPRLPTGLQQPIAQLLGPGASKRDIVNPTTTSWAFHSIIFGQGENKGTAAGLALKDFFLALMSQGIFNANLKVPAAEGKLPWTAVSELLTNRVSVTRKGQQHNGDPYTHKELLNVALHLSSNIAPAVARSLEDWAAEYPNFVTVKTVPPNVTLEELNSQTPEGSSKVLRRPAAAANDADEPRRVRAKVAKRPASRR